MFTTLRKVTVIFLAILQLIAPLVHAHVGEKIALTPNSGLEALHVPGLEVYSVDRDDSISRLDSSHCNSTMHDADSDGMLIAIDAGIKDRPANAGADFDNSHYLHQQALAFNAAIFPFDLTTSSRSAQFVYPLLIPSLSPRAPPAQ